MAADICQDKKLPGRTKPAGRRGELGRIRPRPGKGPAGFTLLEILVAMTLFAVVVTILFGSFSFLFSRSSFVREGITIYEQARTCLDRLACDLRSIYVSLPPAYEPPDFDDDPDPYRLVAASSFGEERSLRFVSFAHLPLGGGLPALAGNMVYYLQKTEDRGLVLRRRDTVRMAGPDEDPFDIRDIEGHDPVVCEQVRSLTFRFFDDQGNSHDYWDSESESFDYATPRAVEVILVVGAGEMEYRFETMVELPVYRQPWEEVG
ncbi:MAG: prepilin-type N-terminal cleavage/methylation domain-containing protein [Desulfosudaceae bacterium]